MPVPTFDLVVIGGGPAGICGANTAAIFGKRVALVEKRPRIGGAGINTGTMPSKTLRETALALSGWRSRKLFGVDLSLRREATVQDFMHHKDDVVAYDRERREEQLHTNKVETFHGTASFVAPPAWNRRAWRFVLRSTFTGKKQRPKSCRPVSTPFRKPAWRAKPRNRCDRKTFPTSWDVRPTPITLAAKSSGTTTAS